MEKEVFKSYLHEYINLLSLYLNKKEASDLTIDNKHLSFYIHLSKHHSLMSFLFKAIKDTKVNVDEASIKKLEEYYLLNVRKVASFNKERKELYTYLNDNDIYYLPLKGIVLKDYYPDEAAREFADNDILFEENKDKLVKEFFTNRDYEVEIFRRSNHDVYLKKPFFNFEMHRALFGETGDNEKQIEYFKDYLNKAHIKDNHEKELNNEDFYIYFTAHTYKHFHVSGCGIRTLIDYYLYLNKHELDFVYIDKELEKLDLLDFSNQIKSLSTKLFNNEPLNEDEEEMLLYISSSGTYGTLEHSVAKGVKEKGKFRYFMSRIFPPYRFYKSAYPWAYYSVILIPIAWLCRFFRILFKNPKRASNEIKAIKNYKEDEEDKAWEIRLLIYLNSFIGAL